MMKTVKKACAALLIACVIPSISLASSAASFWMAANPAPSGCRYETESYSQSICPDGSMILDGEIIWKVCDSTAAVSCEYSLVEEVVLGSATELQCGIGGWRMEGFWQFVTAKNKSTCHLCNGDTLEHVNATPSFFIKGDTGTEQIYCGEYNNFNWYPQTSSSNVNCDDYRTLALDVFPICPDDDPCCGVCGCCIAEQ